MWKIRLGRIPRNFKTFNLKSKLSILGRNDTNDNKGELMDCREFTLYEGYPFYPFLPVYHVVRIAFLSLFCDRWLAKARKKGYSDPVLYS